MPRIHDSKNDIHDFCFRCFPTESEAQAEFGNVGDGPDGRGNCFDYKSIHPPYEETDYICETCEDRLGGEDD